MKGYIQILSAGTADCPPSVVIHFDSQRYLINCGEGTQRLCIESKMRFSKLKTVLLTRTHWDVMGGLPGMLLTLSDAGIRNIKVMGAENLTHALVSTRPFVYRDNMELETIEFNQESTTFKDEVLRITPVPVYPVNYERPERYEWPTIAKSTKSQSMESQNGSANTESEVAAVLPQESGSGVIADGSAAGSKRNSDVLLSAPDSPAVEPELDGQAQRRSMLSSMFNMRRFDREPLVLSKKVKRASNRVTGATSSKSVDGATTEADRGLTDVDMIERQAQAETGHNCGGPRPPNARFMNLPRTSPDLVALSYICQSPDYVGKFNKDAALKLGIPAGKRYSQLMKGETVLSDSGEQVFPHQVVSGARPGRVFMVVDCPTVDYISGLVESKQFEKFYDHPQNGSVANADSKLSAACIVHFGNHTVLSHPQYRAWMQRFGSETQHIVANQDYCAQPLVWKGQSLSNFKLSKLDKSIFPIPYFDNTPEHDLAKDVLSGMEVPIKVQRAEGQLKFQFEPSTELLTNEVTKPISFEDDYTWMRDGDKEYLREYYKLAEQATEEIKAEFSKPEEFPGKDVVISTLGTGSSIPGKYRNVSATLVDTITNGTFLLDAGEGTYGQIFRQFGGYRQSTNQLSPADQHIKNLKGIFISHLHADHHLGIVTVIDRWNKLRTPETDPLYMIAPRKFNTFLQELSDVQDFGYQHVQYIESEDIVYWRDKNNNTIRQHGQKALNGLLETSGFEEIVTVDVIHCPWAYGISMMHKDGWKVVYSGDTRPCNNLVEAGQGATVLLHEATFEEEMLEKALQKKHSTTKEAIMVGEGMDAKFTLLTHFSQRYPSIPNFDGDDKSTTIGICFDLMSVKLSQIPQLPKFLPALRCLFSPQSEEALDEEEESKHSEIKID
ncbi:ribonuclease Z [Entomortierella parvispora]|uniref:ribonuclease Z n=1 Tax=Entomortierella parvispora TaxID=205924 RepID=A0A9P3LWV1_9FUNG|nr:ribonuclease Z [Entomortierella parvispora]